MLVSSILMKSVSENFWENQSVFFSLQNKICPFPRQGICIYLYIFGFNVEDLFARVDVTVSIPSFKIRNRINSSYSVRQTRGGKRMHVDCIIIGLSKTYKH